MRHCKGTPLQLQGLNLRHVKGSFQKPQHAGSLQLERFRPARRLAASAPQIVVCLSASSQGSSRCEATQHVAMRAPYVLLFLADWLPLCLCCSREADNNSKHLQLVSGAHPTAYWLANFSWDMLSYCLPAAGIVLLVWWYHQPQLSGIRLVAMGLLLLAFGGAGINLTYLCHFMFVVSGGQQQQQCALRLGCWVASFTVASHV